MKIRILENGTSIHRDMQIKPYEPHQLNAIVQLSLRALSPVFDSINKTMVTDIYQEFYPKGWRERQQ